MSTFNKIQAARLAARRAGVVEAPKVNGLLAKFATLESNIKTATSKYLDLRVELSDKRYNEGCRFSTPFVAPVIEAPVVEDASADMSFVNLCL